MFIYYLCFNRTIEPMIYKNDRKVYIVLEILVQEKGQL